MYINNYKNTYNNNNKNSIEFVFNTSQNNI